MTQKGNHTWDLAIHYHLCQKCKKIVESRQNVKKIECSFCGNTWTLTEAKVLSDSEEPSEWDWD